jgi:hypothetical protein
VPTACFVVGELSEKAIKEAWAGRGIQLSRGTRLKMTCRDSKLWIIDGVLTSWEL